MSWTEKEPQCHRWKSWTSPIRPQQLAQSLEFCRLLLSCSDVPGTMSRSRYQNDNSKSLSQMWVFALKGIKSFFMFGADTVARLIHSHWARDGHSCSSLSSLYARGTLFMSLCDTVWRRAAAAELRCPFIIITHCHGGVCLLEAVLPGEFNPHCSPKTLSKKHQEWLTCLFPGMLLVCGGLVNGPYSLITTAVSADLVSCFTSDSSSWIHPGLLTQSEHSSLFWPLTSGDPQEPERKRQSAVHSHRHHRRDGICRSVSQITGVSSQIKSECNHMQIFNQPIFSFKMFKDKICNVQTNKHYCFL